MTIALETIVFLSGVAFLAGIIDSMAGGGGLLSLPALMAAGIPPVQAIGTNKLQSAIGTASAVWAYWQKGLVDIRRFLLPAFASFIGSVLGAWTVMRVDSRVLGALVPVLLVTMMIYLLLSPKMVDADSQARLGVAGLLVVIVGIGFYDGFFGPGAGSFFTVTLVALAGMGVIRATAHSKLLNFASNLAGLLVMLMSGKVIWSVGLPMAVANIAGAQIGSRCAMRFGAGVIRPVLVVISLGLTIKLVLDPTNPIRNSLGF